MCVDHFIFLLYMPNETNNFISKTYFVVHLLLFSRENKNPPISFKSIMATEEIDKRKDQSPIRIDDWNGLSQYVRKDLMM